MPIHKKQVSLLIVIFSGLLVPTTSKQRGLEHGTRQVVMRSDGFLDGNDVQGTKAATHVESVSPFNWDAVPECGRQLFGTYAPDPPVESIMRELLPGVDAFYIIHDDEHKGRKSRLDKALKEMSRTGDDGLAGQATWVDWFSEDDFQHGDVKPPQMTCVFNKTYAEPLFLAAINSPFTRNLRHLWVYHEMLRRNLRTVLVMEDNPVFRGEVSEVHDSLKALTVSMPSDDKIVMLGDVDMAQGHPWRAAEIENSFMERHAKEKVSEHVYGPGLGQRGASGYLISQASAASILQYVYNGFKADAEADMLMENALGPEAFYWYEPPLWVQSDSPLKVDTVETAKPALSSGGEANPKAVNSGGSVNLLEEKAGSKDVELPGSNNIADTDYYDHGWSRFHHEGSTPGH